MERICFLLVTTVFKLVIINTMPSSKGKPTDPKLREKVKEEVKNETNNDGSGKGQWSAWKVSDEAGYLFIVPFGPSQY